MSRTPKVRFKGFEKEWEHHSLRDFGSVAMCKRIFKDQTNSDGDIPFYKIGTFGGDPDAYISKDLFEQYRNAFPYPEKGDALISASGSIGRTVVFDGKPSYFQDSNIVWLKHDNRITNPFLAQLYHVVNWGGLEGSTIKRLYNENILNTETDIPGIDEQETIASFLGNLDSLIEQNQSEVDRLRNLKKAMLIKMFPQKGQTVPEIRFKGFEGDWEIRRLGDIGITYTGLSGKTKNDFGHGEARFVTYMNVFLNSVADLKRTELVEIDRRQHTVKFGDVFFTTSSETPEEVGMSSVWLGNGDNIYLNSFCFGYRPTVEINPYFMAYSMRSEYIRSQFIFLAQGISRYNISKNRAMDIKLKTPSIEEQSAIGEYFYNLEALIEQRQSNTDRLRHLKQSMLQRMFI